MPRSNNKMNAPQTTSQSGYGLPFYKEAASVVAVVTSGFLSSSFGVGADEAKCLAKYPRMRALNSAGYLSINAQCQAS